MSDKIIIKIPDIGGATDVDVIEILVKPGDSVAVDDSLITLESDKASMEVPASTAGTVAEILVKVGDKVSEGHDVVTLTADDATAAPEKSVAQAEPPVKDAQAKPAAVVVEPEQPAVPEPSQAEGADVHAGPAVRRIARELEIDLQQIAATGDKGRITKEDLQRYVKGSASSNASGLALASAPVIDFSRFGSVRTEPLSKIKKFSGANLHRNWVTIPHVTQFEEADVTDLEAFRQQHKQEAAQQGAKLTPIVFIMKAVVAALQKFPDFNSSLSSDGGSLILKDYFHIGVAVDTPNGLVVPVIRDVDQKGVFVLAQELGAISKKARETGLGMKDMQGGCFSISSLGGIGGTAFTPIVNAPEVAILGVSRSQTKPVYNEAGDLVPRLMMPLSLSYDHRVIDGAAAARFVVYLANCLADLRRLIL